MKVYTMLRLAAWACLVGSLTAGAANANLITNGDFATGDFTGWVNVGNSDDNFVVSGDDNILPDAVDFAVIGVGNASGTRSIYQDFDAPTQDHWLTVTFDYGFGGATTFPGADLFEAFVDIDGFDNIELLSIASPAGIFLSTGTVMLMFEVTGADNNSPNARLSFTTDEAGGLFSGVSGAGIDNVVVTAEIHDGHPVPAPATWALFGTGLIGLRYLRRRRVT